MTTKQWLNRYRKATLRIRMYRLQIEELETIAEGGAINIKPAPSGKNKNFDPVQESAVKIADLITKIEQLEQDEKKILTEITDAINKVDDEAQHSILTMRYIKCMHWKSIADELGFSEIRTYQIHGDALQKIKSL